MKQHKKQSQPVSRTIQSKNEANNQASAKQILQRYQDKVTQRQEVDEEELLQGKFETAQREVLDDEEEPLPSSLSEKPVNNTGLPDDLKTGIENLSGFSMDDVRVHYNSDKPAQLQALAYAQGTDIHVAPGQEKHLPHEAWHVVQQKQGRVSPTMQLQGVNVNDDERLEKEADNKVLKVLQKTTSKKSVQKKQINSELIQRIDNTARNMTSVDQNGELFVQSNDKSQFRYALPVPMTYHHVIPRNKLADFWNNLRGNSHLKYLTGGISQLIKSARKRIDDVAALAGSTVFDINGIRQSAETITDIMEHIGELEDGILNNAELQGAQIIEKIYQWWPANIHHGPNDRPRKIDMNMDDGDDLFEESAKHIMKGKQFKLLKKTNDLIDSYKVNPQIKTIKNINGLIGQLNGYGFITPFKENHWFQIKSGPLTGKWRIKPS